MTSGTTQKVDVATALMSVSEIITNQKPACVKSFDKQITNKAVCSQFGGVLIEANQYNLFNLMIGQCLNFVSERADLGGDHFRPHATPREIRAWVRVKGHDGRCQVPRFCHSLQAI